ncbi:MAG: hypothetical protein IJT22_04225 [Synergistaceae bacterium]|nr:hypothetical protein [Synergistaceae bacterium]
MESVKKKIMLCIRKSPAFLTQQGDNRKTADCRKPKIGYNNILILNHIPYFSKKKSFCLRKGNLIMQLKNVVKHVAPKGMRWVFCRFRRVKNSQRKLDAWDYGYNCWAFLVRA